MVVELVGGFVIACCVGFDGLFDHVDRATEEVGIRRHGGLCRSTERVERSFVRVVVVRESRGRLGKVG